MTPAAMRPLAGWQLEVPEKAPLASRLCAHHLGLLGARVRSAGGGDALAVDRMRLSAASREARGVGGATACEVRWPVEGADGEREALAQGLCGVMSVHGRDAGAPRRLHLMAVGAAGGILAAQGLLGAVLAGLRGRRIEAVEVSALRAGSFYISQHIAAATGAAGWPAAPGGREADPGPPFPTADGAWVELEMLSPAAWRAFWLRLDVDERTAGRGWLPLATRHGKARCSLPPALHRATSGRTLDELRAVAAGTGTSLVRCRRWSEAAAGGGESEAPWRLEGATVGSVRLPAGPAGRRHGGPPLGAGLGVPLTGVRVLEATTRVQGPLAGQLLRMLGVEVTRIEPPGGDPGRLSASAAGSVGAAHAAYNRGKRPLEVDYRSPEGRDAILDAAAGSDVFLHNWCPGRAAELGLDSNDLLQCSPSTVYAHASGWGPDAAGLPTVATDYLVQPHLGLAEAVDGSAEPLVPSRVTLVDLAGRWSRRRGSSLPSSSGSGPAAPAASTPPCCPAGAPSDGLSGLQLGDDAPSPDVCTDLAALRDRPPEAGLLEPVEGGGWAPAPPWRFR